MKPLVATAILFIYLVLACYAPTLEENHMSRSVDESAARSAFIASQIEAHNAFITDSELKTAKYEKMKESPFAFYRATAHLYFKDLELGTIPVPAQWEATPEIETWLQGDYHPRNIGYFENDNAEIIFDLNDFDEAWLGPFYWDLIRFAAGVYLMQEDVDFNLSDSEADDVVYYFLEKYQEILEEDTNTDMDADFVGGIIRDKLDELADENSLQDLLNKWTVITDEGRVFDFADPELAVPTSAEQAEIESNWNSYLASIPDLVADKGAAFFRIKGIAKRLMSGLGSLGRDKFYILITGDSLAATDDLLLEVKEQCLPSLFYNSRISFAIYQNFFSSHATRTLTACKALLRNAEDFFGRLEGSNASYFVRKLSPYKYNFEAEDFESQKDFEKFLKYAAYALGQAHNRADKDFDSRYIDYSFENAALAAIAEWPETKKTIRDLGKNYAAQVKTDFAFFLANF